MIDCPYPNPAAWVGGGAGWVSDGGLAGSWFTLSGSVRLGVGGWLNLKQSVRKKSNGKSSTRHWRYSYLTDTPVNSVNLVRYRCVVV